MLSKIIPTAALLAGQAAATIYYAGVAESGGEFGVYSTQVLIQSNQWASIYKEQALRLLLVLDFQAGLELTTISSTRALSIYGWTRITY